MNKSNQKILAILIPTSILFAIIFFYVINLPENKNQSVNVRDQQASDNQTDSSSFNNYSQENSDGSVEEESSTQTITDSRDNALTLSINKSRCSGCGKCTRIDPEHFSLSGHTATVISNSNLDSANLQSAISMCHDNAISLE